MNKLAMKTAEIQKAIAELKLRAEKLEDGQIVYPYTAYSALEKELGPRRLARLLGETK